MNRLHAFLPTLAKRCAWNLKYGWLGYPQLVAPKDALEYLSAGLSENGALLELGCGRGSLIRGLRRNGWTGYYCGVDISNQAINDARKFEDLRSSWVVSDFESFRHPSKWDAVAMIESIYYIRLGELPPVLRRIMGMLREHGVLLVRLHDPDKHAEYVGMIRQLYPEMNMVGNNLFCISASSRSVDQ